MPFLRDDLLTPIPGENPSGANLYYSPIFDKIKEARFEDEDSGPFELPTSLRKKADFVAVIKLAGDTLATKTKDLQLAAWLAEAHIQRDGFAALPECLELFLHLQETFWDTLYPPIEDGIPDRRATPQEWFAARCDYLLRRLPLTTNKLDWLKYRESRSIGYEEDAASSDDKKRIRQEAIDEGKMTAEEFDEGFSATPKTFYENLSSLLDTTLECAGTLDAFCEQKYGDVSPNFAKLRGVVDEIKQAVLVLLTRKGEAEPDVPSPEAPTAEESPPESGALTPGAPVSASARAARAPSLGEPQTVDDAFALAGLVADYLRKQDPANAVSYLLRRALRWGELRSQGESPDPASLTAPSTELRQQLKRLYSESNWEELLAAAEAAVTSPCGRGWLDLQRYSWYACDQLSHAYAAQAICSATRGLLQDYPNLPQWTLTDDTPTANADTKTWIAERVMPQKPEEQEVVVAAMPAAQSDSSAANNGRGERFEAAMQLAKSGKIAEAVESLSREAAREASGRERFQRQLEVSRLCVSTGHFTIAVPILQSMVAELERRGLFDWEDGSLVAQPLILLVQCMDRTKRDPAERSRVYDLLCRLGPSYALQLEK